MWHNTGSAGSSAGFLALTGTPLSVSEMTAGYPVPWPLPAVSLHNSHNLKFKINLHGLGPCQTLRTLV